MKCFFTRFGLCATMAFAFAGVSTPAGAQDSAPAALPAPLPNAQPYPAPPAPPAPSVVNTAPFAGITALGQTLKNEGIYLQLAYAYDMNSLVSGGLKTGTIPNGELSFFGAVLDLQKIAGIQGASAHVTFDERSGFGLNGLAGTQGSVEANIGPTRSIRLSELFWEQAFYNDRIDIAPAVLAEVQGIRRCRLRGFCPELRLKFPVGGYIRAPMAAERKSNARTRDLHDCSRWAVFVAQGVMTCQTR